MEKNREIEGELLLFLALELCSGCHLARAQAGSQHKLEVTERSPCQLPGLGVGGLNATIPSSKY